MRGLHDGWCMVGLVGGVGCRIDAFGQRDCTFKAITRSQSRMQILRTPDSQFESLPEWPFEPHYTTIRAEDGTPIRIAHAEQGPIEGEPIVLMHGNPSWSYLHRHMMAPLAATGRRVIAVDLVGHGRSDKPASKHDYTLASHIDWMSKWLLAMDLQHVTLYCPDWGGTMGLHLVAN